MSGEFPPLETDISEIANVEHDVYDPVVVVAEAQNTQTEPVGITFESAAAANSDLTMALDATAANPFFAGGSLSTSLGLLTITGAQNLSFVSVPASAPEPGTLGLGSLAGLGVLMAARRRRQAAFSVTGVPTPPKPNGCTGSSNPTLAPRALVCSVGALGISFSHPSKICSQNLHIYFFPVSPWN